MANGTRRLDEEMADPHWARSRDGSGLGRGMGAGGFAGRTDRRSNDSMDEPWLVVGMLPGFLCGAVFSAVAGIADRRHGLDELSFSRAGAWGVASGLLVGGLWLVLALLSDPPQWLLNLVVVGSLTLLSAVSGVGAALMARMRKNDASPRVA